MHPFADSISAICIASAWSDGQITDVEKQALDRILIHLGYSRAQVMQMIGEALENGPSGESIVIPGDRETQTEYMRFALAVSLADGQLTPHKIKFLAELANFLAIPPQLLEELKLQSEAILRPRDQAAVQGPDRVEVLLPPQRISLGTGAGQGTAGQRDLESETRVRKPLAELLYQGRDYGGEISLG